MYTGAGTKPRVIYTVVQCVYRGRYKAPRYIHCGTVCIQGQVQSPALYTLWYSVYTGVGTKPRVIYTVVQCVYRGRYKAPRYIHCGTVCIQG